MPDETWDAIFDKHEPEPEDEYDPEPTKRERDLARARARYAQDERKRKVGHQATKFADLPKEVQERQRAAAAKIKLPWEK